MLITSTSNDRIKQARNVRDGNEPHLIFVEGQRLVEECVRSGLAIRSCFHTQEPAERTQALLMLLAELGVPSFATQDRVLASLSDTVTPQGIIVVAERPVHTLEAAMSRPGPLLVGMDRVQDPGNFGTLVRTAEAAGATGIIALPGSADAFSPKSLRSAMGSAFRLPIVTALAAADVLAACRQHGIHSVAACGTGETLHYAYDWRQPTLLWLGNEGRGVDATLLQTSTARLRIPLQAGVESLNVASAGAAMLFEAVRQRGSH
jgi:TrmH family RNA methyltransferase